MCMSLVTRGSAYSCIAVTVGGGVRASTGIGTGITGGYTGCYTDPTDCPRAEPHPPTSDRRERAPALAGVGRKQGGVTPSRVPGLGNPRPCPHPCGARSPFPCPWQGLPGTCPPRSKRATFDLIYCKVSQKAIVSPKSVEKACHSPYLQNGLRKSPLEILRFTVSPAFSHKELMVPF